MPNLKLTKTVVEKLPIPEKGQMLYHDLELKGFGVCIGQQSKTYFVQRAINGRTVRTTIGRHGVFTTELARNEARTIIAQMVKGTNPNKKKQEDRVRGLRLKDVVESYIKVKKVKLSTITIEGYREVADRYLADWLNKPLKEISREMVAEKHTTLGQLNGESTANGTMRVFRALYNYAKVLDDKLPENPVLYLSRTKTWYKDKRRQSIIKPHQLAAWYKAVTEIDNPITSDYLLLLFFTGMRKTEGMCLKWVDVDFDDKTFILRETKNGEDLILPMSSFIYDLLNRRHKARHKDDIYVFPGKGKHGHLEEPKRAMQQVTDLSGVNFILHDLRRTFVTIAESLDISAYALKYLLNHKNGGDVTGGYIILTPERMREPMQKITDYILEKVQASGEQEQQPITQEIFPAAIADRLRTGESSIRVFREYRNLTQKELAELTGVTDNYISMLERGSKRNPSHKMLKAIAGVLRVPQDKVA
jgi:integrase/DNA-binding XRE family transcriptional regulator